MKAWRLVVGVLLLGLSLWPVLPAYAQGQMQVWVDDSYCRLCTNDGHTWGVNAFDSISAGLRAVTAGGTVYVLPGRYREDVRIVQSCRVVAEGAGRPVLAPRSADVTLTIAANHVAVQGLEIVESRQAAILVRGPDFQRERIRGIVVRQNTIRGGHFGVAVNIDCQTSHGLLPAASVELGNSAISAVSSVPSVSSWDYGLLPAARVEISENTVAGCKRAIYVYNTEAEITGNTISALADDGIGIYSSQDSLCNIRANVVNVDAPNGRAICILDNEGTAVEGNTLVGTTELLTPTTAIALYGFADLLLGNNTVRGFYSGASAYTGGSARIAGNTFDGTVGWALDLATAITATQVTIEDNLIRGSYWGLRLADDGGYGLQARVHGNTFSDNVVGIQLAASLEEDQVQIRGNMICGNLVAGLRNESEVPADAADNWWGANDGPRPAGSGDRIEGVGGALIDPWVRLVGSTRLQSDGRVTIMTSFGDGRYRLGGESITFSTDGGTFDETGGPSWATLTDRQGEVQATLRPPPGGIANVTIRSNCGQGLIIRVPPTPELRVEKGLPLP